MATKKKTTLAGTPLPGTTTGRVSAKTPAKANTPKPGKVASEITPAMRKNQKAGNERVITDLARAAKPGKVKTAKVPEPMKSVLGTLADDTRARLNAKALRKDADAARSTPLNRMSEGLWGMHFTAGKPLKIGDKAYAIDQLLALRASKKGPLRFGIIVGIHRGKGRALLKVAEVRRLTYGKVRLYWIIDAASLQCLAAKRAIDYSGEQLPETDAKKFTVVYDGVFPRQWGASEYGSALGPVTRKHAERFIQHQQTHGQRDKLPPRPVGKVEFVDSVTERKDFQLEANGDYLVTVTTYVYDELGCYYERTTKQYIGVKQFTPTDYLI